MTRLLERCNMIHIPISITRPRDWFKRVALRWIEFGYELGYGFDWEINR